MTLKKLYHNRIFVTEYESTDNPEIDIQITREILMSKGLLKEISTVESMFGLANSFARVAIDIYETDFKKSPFDGSRTSPFIVNGAFAIELYIKTIYTLCKNPQRGHHLIKLYEGLDKQVKDVITICEQQLQENYDLSEGANIRTCLEALSKAFEQWRYLYEHERLQVQVQEIRFSMHVFGETCRQLLVSEKIIKD